jgi:SAM-dependent methyltransferase
VTRQSRLTGPDRQSGQAAADPDEIRRLFDAQAAGWPARYAAAGSLAGRLTSMLGAVLEHAGPGDRVLDLGCGSGELARALAAAGLRVAGCDISPEMLRRAAAEGCHPAGWLLLAPRWRALPFAAGSLDVVVAASVLEFVAEPVTVLRECARVLRPGGVLLCTVPDLRHPVRWAEMVARGLAGPAAGGGQRQAAGGTRQPGGGTRHAGWSRWHGYQGYLLASRQRHRAGWWLAAARQAGLQPAGAAEGRQSPLRLLAFRRPDAAAGAAQAGVPAGPGVPASPGVAGRQR